MLKLKELSDCGKRYAELFSKKYPDVDTDKLDHYIPLASNGNSFYCEIVEKYFPEYIPMVSKFDFSCYYDFKAGLI